MNRASITWAAPWVGLLLCAVAFWLALRQAEPSPTPSLEPAIAAERQRLEGTHPLPPPLPRPAER